MTKGKNDIVYFEVDIKSPPALSVEDKARLEALAAMPDSDIDYSDAPALSDEAWEKAKPNHHYRPIKKQVTTLIDADVLDWLKAPGAGYQTRLNAFLRALMLEEEGQKRDAPKITREVFRQIGRHNRNKKARNAA